MQLEHDNQTSLPEVCCALRARQHRRGRHGGGHAVRRRAQPGGASLDWCKVARAYAAVRKARIGVMGHVYEGMLDMNSDPTMFDAAFGMHCEHIELDDLHALRRGGAAGRGQRQARGDPRPVRLSRARRRPHRRAGQAGGRALGGHAWPAAWTGWSSSFGLTGLAYYYRGLDGNANERLGCVAYGGQLAADRAGRARWPASWISRTAWPCCSWTAWRRAAASPRSTPAISSTTSCWWATTGRTTSPWRRAARCCAG